MKKKFAHVAEVWEQNRRETTFFKSNSPNCLSQLDGLK